MTLAGLINAILAGLLYAGVGYGLGCLITWASRRWYGGPRWNWARVCAVAGFAVGFLVLLGAGS
jgi:hypothetical protein